MASIGDRVRQRRLELGLTQIELARQSRIAQSTVAVLERNGYQQTRYIGRLAAVLRVSALWLQDGIGPMEASDGVPLVVLPPQHSERVQKLAERLALLPDEKLKALSVLFGVKLL